MLITLKTERERQNGGGTAKEKKEERSGVEMSGWTLIQRGRGEERERQRERERER